MHIGLNIGLFDSALSLFDIQDRKVINPEHLLSERMSQEKHLGGFPLAAAKLLLKRKTNLTNSHVAINSFYHHPKEIEEKYKPEFKKFLSTFGLDRLTLFGNKEAKFITHHLCHAYSLLYQYPFEESLILVIDGGGTKASDSSEFEVISVYHQKGKELTLVKKTWAPLNKKFSAIMGMGSKFEFASRKLFGNWYYAGKIMGLSSYGDSPRLENLEDIANEFKIPDRKEFSKNYFDNLNKDEFNLYANLSSCIQKDYEIQIENLITDLKNQFPHIDNISITGGCALNCLSNGKLYQKQIFKNIFIPTYPSDMGVSLGAALASAYQDDKIDFHVTPLAEISLNLGAMESHPDNNQKMILEIFSNYQINHDENIHQTVAELIVNGEVVAWFQGRSESGPRALGNRSILALPSKNGMKKFLNDNIKFREEFRPYGCSLLHEDASTYFNVEESFHSPFMGFALPVLSQWKSIFQEVMHIDGTTRVQTVTEKQNKKYHALLRSIKNECGHGVVLNTSLNIMGKPILETVQDAYNFFANSEVKYLAIGNYLIQKS